jgi:membrane-associated phospholipid phosphatase
MIMKRLSPFHGLTLFFLVGLIILTLLFRGKVPLWYSLVFRYLLCIGLLFVVQLPPDQKKSGKFRKFVNTSSPIFFIVLIYESLGDLIHHLHPDIDPALMRIELYLFGVQPTIWMQRWIVPWLTDLLSFAYLSYYFLPVTLVTVLYLKKRPGLYPTLFVLTLGYYVSFIGYILFPAVGPRYAMTSLYTVPLEGSFITDWVRDGLNAIQHNIRDCMPSGHTQIALTVLYLAYRYERKVFYIFLPFVCGFVLSTIYLRYHYVIDLFAGTAIAISCMIIGPRFYRWWCGKN